MKILKKCTLLLGLGFVMCNSSCKKDRDYIPGGYNQPNAKCLVTHTEDDLWGYSVDIFYNHAGDPDSMSYRGYPVTIEYDNRKRLVKAVFGESSYGENRSYFTYLYKDNSFLPTVLKYYNPSFGGLLAIDSFKYNHFGQIIKIGTTKLLNPIYNMAEYFEYDNKGNVKKVTTGGENGGTAYDVFFTEFEVLKYDNKPNIMGGNQWLKYLFFFTELYDQVFMMFSRNNVVDWLWRPEAYASYYPDPYFLSATFEYSHKDFANKMNIRFYDFYGSENYFEGTRLFSTTCDVNKGKLQVPGLKNAKVANILSKRKDGLPFAIQSP